MTGRGIAGALTGLALAGLAFAGLPAHAQMIGNWQGVGLQTSAGGGRQETWDIRITIRADLTSRIAYPSLDCHGELREISRKPDMIEFEERITSGDCMDGGRLLLTLRAGRLGYFWWKPGVDVDASGVLHRDAGMS